jgi:hypothetical protein
MTPHVLNMTETLCPISELRSSLSPTRRYICHAKPYNGWHLPLPQQANMKPAGMWYSVGDSWLEWCENEEPEWVHKYVSDVTLDLPRILVINSLEMFDAFTEECGNFETPAGWRYRIDWPRVASRYAGIEIAPYFWERRLEPAASWYYSWDCASGCIWDASALLDRRVIRERNDDGKWIKTEK